MNLVPHAPITQAASMSAPLAQLKIPPSMPLLMQEDYPHVHFWNKENWVKFEEWRNRGGNTAKNSKMDFLCDEAGNPLSDTRHKQITEAGKSAYNSLYHYRMDPISWTKGDDDAKQYVNNILETNSSSSITAHMAGKFLHGIYYATQTGQPIHIKEGI